MNNCVVIGGKGMVGNSTMHTFGIKDCFDLRGSNITLKEVAERKRFVFICTPTPTNQGEQQGIEEMEALIKQIIEIGGGQKVFIIRSTVLPGACKRLMQNCGTEAIIHNPEFLTESSWELDSEHPDVIVLGGERTNYLEDVEALYKARFKGSVDIIKTDTLTSETIKYAVNCLYTTKVVFANQLYDYCEKFNINYEDIKKVMYKRKWIGKNHLRIFDKENNRGAGGKCLGKDCDAFASRSGIELLRMVNKLNKIYTGEN